MARQQRLDLAREGAPSFDTFVVGGSNSLAAQAVAGWRGGTLAVIGPAGSGKSHLAQAWARRNGAVAFAPDQATIAGQPVLLEDADQAVADEALFHLINVATREGGGLLLTARSLPATWPTALPDLRSRLNALPVVEIGPPDDAVLEGVLRQFFQRRNIRPPEEVYGYLLARMGRSIPDAAEIVRRLDEAGDAGFRPVTRVLARQILEQNQELDL